MYSRKSWGGAIDPFILTKFEKQSPDGDKDPVVSLVIFEWNDEGYVGRLPNPESLDVRSKPCPTPTLDTIANAL